MVRRRLKRLWNDFLGAICFLTRFPVPCPPQDDLGRSLAFFPLAGLLLGSVLALTAPFWALWSRSVGAVGTLALLLLLTGGIHADGLMDSADGLFGARERERSLEIMRDSRVGAMAVMVFAAVYGLKATLLATMAHPLPALLLFPVLGRWGAVLGAWRSSDARSGGGQAGVFLGRRRDREALVATGLTVVATLTLQGPSGLLPLAMAAAVVWLWRQYVLRRLGGQTGDTLGAAVEIGETAALLGLGLLPFR